MVAENLKVLAVVSSQQWLEKPGYGMGAEIGRDITDPKPSAGGVAGAGPPEPGGNEGFQPSSVIPMGGKGLFRRSVGIMEHQEEKVAGDAVIVGGDLAGSTEGRQSLVSPSDHGQELTPGVQDSHIAWFQFQSPPQAGLRQVTLLKVHDHVRLFQQKVHMVGRLQDQRSENPHRLSVAPGSAQALGMAQTGWEVTHYLI